MHCCPLTAQWPARRGLIARLTDLSGVKYCSSLWASSAALRGFAMLNAAPPAGASHCWWPVFCFGSGMARPSQLVPARWKGKTVLMTGPSAGAVGVIGGFYLPVSCFAKGESRSYS